MTTIAALTDLEQGALRMWAAGDSVVAIAREYDIPASSIRGLLHRCCDFDRNRAERILNGGAGPAPVKPPAPPAPPAKPAPPTAALAPPPVVQAATKPPAPSSKPPAPRPAPAALPAAITAQLEVTYRVLDYWTSRGYIQADENRPGSGRKRTWSPAEQKVAQLMARLCQAGLTPAGAHHAARNNLHTLDAGVRIVLDEHPSKQLDAPPDDPGELTAARAEIARLTAELAEVREQREMAELLTTQMAELADAATTRAHRAETQLRRQNHLVDALRTVLTAFQDVPQ